MSPDLDPRQVEARLAALRAIAVLETVEEGIRRLERERPRTIESFARRVERRLAELRALDELARHLHQQR